VTAGFHRGVHPIEPAGSRDEGSSDQGAAAVLGEVAGVAIYGTPTFDLAVAGYVVLADRTGVVGSRRQREVVPAAQ